jgi:hypothetical protein
MKPTHPIIPIAFGHHDIVSWHSGLRVFGKGDGRNLVRPMSRP